MCVTLCLTERVCVYTFTHASIYGNRVSTYLFFKIESLTVAVVLPLG